MLEGIYITDDCERVGHDCPVYYPDGTLRPIFHAVMGFVVYSTVVRLTGTKSKRYFHIVELDWCSISEAKDIASDFDVGDAVYDCREVCFPNPMPLWANS